ncbi:response regulator receiver protein [Syntrophobotulus glycolicus DSM 8271]|uniref:Stage 0 sporulation protein A homolog n=1 Tax=Syntrophobotulus glycolicus (strain DSM 8271 / FlGlyR) TaxID=645991 RepID=F0T2D1_SYNGF|nr:response regulator [Syntrophobotulus glycolicus]ADY57559.1 response regulator receiver protein [Syntrophobotulus glycolicus DSM 8271]
MPRILIVDDQVGIRRLLTEVFKDCGYEIETCASGVKALEIMSEFKPDLLLMDVKMPGMNGIDVLKKIREENDRQIKVIMMTAYGDQEHINTAEELGVVGFIIKPFDINELREQIKDVLREKEE